MQRVMTFVLILLTIFFFSVTKIGMLANEQDEIPEDSIRLRIIANSNDDIDQEIKLKIRDAVVEYIYPKVSKIDDVTQARVVVYDQVEELNTIINSVLKEHELDTNFYVDYGRTNFPTKVYNDKVYRSGQYEAIYIVLGEGKGENWWCVLFPPLCLVDVTISDEVTDYDEIEYASYFFEKIKGLFSNK